MIFSEGASVFVQPRDPWPDHGGGPVRRGGPQTIRLVEPPQAGNTVYRTPHQVVKEGEPGAVVPGLTKMKFLPDGRLVPRGALGAAEVIPYQGTITKIVRDFNVKKGFTARSAQPLLADALTFARAFMRTIDDYRWPSAEAIRLKIGAPLATIRGQIKNKLAGVIKQLDYLLALMKKQEASPFVFTAQHQTWHHVRQAILQPYYLASEYTVVVATGNAAEMQLLVDMGKNLLALPAKVAEAAGKIAGEVAKVAASTAKSFLGTLVPWWVWALGGVVVVGGVGTAVYIGVTHRRAISAAVVRRVLPAALVPAT